MAQLQASDRPGFSKRLHSLKVILGGLKSHLTGYRQGEDVTGGTNSARYCYSVWLRHLSYAGQYCGGAVPGTVAELGPGDSVGIGLAALLSGASRYHGLDIVEYANPSANLPVLDEIRKLYEKRTPLPGPDEFPALKPYLPSYEFPHDLLPDSRLQAALRPARVAAIAQALKQGHAEIDGETIEIRYFAPWNDPSILQSESIDLLFSQAVLEHVDDLEQTYDAMRRWLKPGCVMTHQIDFGAHFTSLDWNGHWGYSDFVWNLIRGKRPFLLNRQPVSVHRRLLTALGFERLQEQPVRDDSGLRLQDLASPFRSFSEDDCRTRGVFLLARRA